MANKLSKKIVKFPKKIVEHYINNIEKDIKLNGIFLFGSFACGKPDKHSDVDLIIVSSNFNKMDFDKRMDWLQHKRDKTTFQIAMDIIGYTPREFRYIDKHSAVMANIKKHGKWILQDTINN